MNTIVRAAIHPGIGVARLGDSPECYIGPEVRFPARVPANYYKDDTGRIKRQAARFRIYGYDQTGNVVAELDASNATITWTVHVANTKAAWYAFQRAMDLPDALSAPRRNAAFVGDRRSDLSIDPGPQSVPGQPNLQGPQFDTGKFVETPVYLGELRTDADGRLLFLGGRGVAATPFERNPPYTYANNDGWYDDTSDGPVSATVEIDGRQIPVEPAWVVVAPPNFAPDVVSVQTMYDVLIDTYQGLWLDPVTTPSFTQHIYPLLRQFSDLQWVNYGFHVEFGWGGPHDFLRESYLYRLATITRDPDGTRTDIYDATRRQLLHLFRDPSQPEATDPSKWPQMYGDTPGLAAGPHRNLSLTATQYGYLTAWAAGNFIDDWESVGNYPTTLDQVELADRPDALDRAALWFCLGGPFHPGAELSWPMRTQTMYCAPFRIRPRTANRPDPDYGDVLTPEVVKSDSGPLFANGPGDLTRWLAVPWQTDSVSCRSGYDKEYDPYLPTFWPARVPNHVLSDEHYLIVMDQTRTKEERLRAFDTRSVWLRFFSSVGNKQSLEMIQDFHKLGVIERRDGPEDGEYPSVLYVESQVGFTQRPPFRQNLTNVPAEKLGRPRRRVQTPS